MSEVLVILISLAFPVLTWLLLVVGDWLLSGKVDAAKTRQNAG